MATRHHVGFNFTSLLWGYGAMPIFLGVHSNISGLDEIIDAGLMLGVASCWLLWVAEAPVSRRPQIAAAHVPSETAAFARTPLVVIAR